METTRSVWSRICTCGAWRENVTPLAELKSKMIGQADNSIPGQIAILEPTVSHRMQTCPK